MVVGLIGDVGGMAGPEGGDVVGRDPSGGDVDAGAAVVLTGGADDVTGATASAAAEEPDGAS